MFIYGKHKYIVDRTNQQERDKNSWRHKYLVHISFKIYTLQEIFRRNVIDLNEIYMSCHEAYRSRFVEVP
jgi:hypothetical protein